MPPPPRFTEPAPEATPCGGAEASLQDAVPPPMGGSRGGSRGEGGKVTPRLPPNNSSGLAWAVALQLGGAPRIQGYPAVATATTSRPRIWGGLTRNWRGNGTGRCGHIQWWVGARRGGWLPSTGYKLGSRRNIKGG